MDWDEIQDIRAIIQYIRDCGNDREEHVQILTKAQIVLAEYLHIAEIRALSPGLVSNIKGFIGGADMRPRLMSDTKYALLDIADWLKSQ